MSPIITVERDAPPSEAATSSSRRRLVIALETDRPFQLRNNREEGAVLMVRRAEIAQSGMRLALEALSERLGQSRFPDPGLG
jgi:hypothetical protein